MIRFLPLALVVVLSGCSSMPGMPNHLVVRDSQVDGYTEVKTKPGMVYRSDATFAGSDLKLGLYWDSEIGDRAIILATAPNQFVRIRSREALVFNIDGDIVRVSADGRLTDYRVLDQGTYYGRESVKGFPVPLSLINRLLSAELVTVRLTTASGPLEGVFTADKQSAAIRGFRAARQEIKAHQ